MPHNRIPDGLPLLEDLPPGDRNVFYIERPINGDRGLVKWMLGLASAMIISAILGAFSVTGQMAALSADVRNLKEQVAELKRLIEPRYRGVDHDDAR